MFDPTRRILVLGVWAAGCTSGVTATVIDGAVDRPAPGMAQGDGSGGGGGADVGPPGARPDTAGTDATTPGMPPDSGRVDLGSVAPPDSGRVDLGMGTRPDSGNVVGIPDLPVATGTCPQFVAGDVTFNPPGGARVVTITMGEAAKTQRGPLIFYWHATNSSVREAAAGLPLPAITAAGGIVVAPQDLPNAGVYPWLQNFTRHDALFDEVVGCAVKTTMFDPRHIHAVGFSAGGLMTTHLSYARSSVLASIAAYSGGAAGQFQEPNNKFAALIFTGGPRDMVVINFFNSSQQWHTTLKNAGHFALFCDHGGNHSIPTRLVPGVWQFFQDHPYGTRPSPYAGGKVPMSLNPPCVE